MSNGRRFIVGDENPPNGGFNENRAVYSTSKLSSRGDSCFASRETAPIAIRDTSCRVAQDVNLRLDQDSAQDLEKVPAPDFLSEQRAIEKTPQVAGFPDDKSCQLGDISGRRKCGSGARTAEWKARQSDKLLKFWSDPEKRQRHREKIIVRMASPAVRDRISKATAAALARPDVKEHHIAGLKRRYVDDPDLRRRVSEATKAGMARWRAEKLAAAETVIRQLPKAERDNLLEGIKAALGRSG